MRLVLLAALALIVPQAHAQTDQVCLSKTITGQPLPASMCFTPQALANADECDAMGKHSAGLGCESDRPQVPRATGADEHFNIDLGG